MPLLFWDASALAKRYAPELGSDVVNALFAGVSPRDMATTPWGYVETFSILLRRYNGGVLDRPSFTTATTALQADIFDSPDFGLLPITDAVIFASVATISRHNLNATDAAILTMLLEYVRMWPANSGLCVLVAADKRLLRAAEIEGLRTLNPESFPAGDVTAFLQSL